MTTSPHDHAASPERDHKLLIRDVRWFLGSPLLGAFGGLALDQVAYRSIAAAVDRTGRFADNFTDRGVRSFAFTALMSFGDPTDAQALRDELKLLHRDVKGTGQGSFADTRYSALAPEVWIWVAVSGLHLGYRGYLELCGRELDDEEKDVVYQTIRSEMAYLELPSKNGKLPATRTEMLDYYDHVAATELADNEFLQFARRHFIEPPIPSLLVSPRRRALMRPIWGPLMKVATRPTIVCSDGLAHQRMRDLFNVRWTARDQAEYTAYVTVLRLAWRWLPRKLTLEPLAYNRYRYERLRNGYRKLLLESFAVPPERAE